MALKRSSKFYALRFAVECKPDGQAFYESIAAFNHRQIAIDYAIECRQYHPFNRYRVWELKANNRWELIEIDKSR